MTKVMTKAALATSVFLIRQCFAWSQDTTPSLACSASTETAECESISKASALLQVERSQVKTSEQIQSPLDQAGLDRSDGQEDESMEKLLKKAGRQMDDLKVKVESLETTVESQQGRKPSDSEDSQDDENPSGDEADNSPSGKDKDSDKADESPSDDWANDDRSPDLLYTPTEFDDDPSSRRRGKLDYYPDWDGVAPGKPWNGLENASAGDKGGHDSRKGNGVGVVSGKKYKNKGDDPYEMLMDVDFVIDSNPAKKAKSQSKPEEESPRQEGKSAPKHGGKEQAKSSPRHGGKDAPKASPKESAKSGPKQGGKDEPKASPKAGGKDEARQGGKEQAKTSPRKGGKSDEEPAKTSPKRGGKSTGKGL